MIRIATIGTSLITENFIEVVHEHPETQFVGTLSRDEQRASAFTSKYGGTQPFVSIDELAASSAVDAVYIGSPNAAHAAQALSCIAGGKHILVEKPFAANRDEAQRVFDAAQRAHVVALEAMRPVHDPAYYHMRELLDRLGRIRRATLRFGKYSSRYDEILAGRRTNIFDCACASGALMDIGIYTVETLIELFGVPNSFTFAPVLLDASTGALTNGTIDGAGTILANYNDMIASLHYSKITMDHASCQIEGERGTLTLDSLSLPHTVHLDFHGKVTRGDAKHSAAQANGETQKIELPQVPNTMIYELDDFVCAIKQVASGAQTANAACGEHGNLARFRDLTLASLSLTDEARRQAGIVFAADR